MRNDEVFHITEACWAEPSCVKEPSMLPFRQGRSIPADAAVSTRQSRPLQLTIAITL